MAVEGTYRLAIPQLTLELRDVVNTADCAMCNLAAAFVEGALVNRIYRRDRLETSIATAISAIPARMVASVDWE
jgi:hypothetical protein